jgi:hypothetical protein
VSGEVATEALMLFVMLLLVVLVWKSFILFGLHPKEMADPIFH